MKYWTVRLGVTVFVFLKEKSSVLMENSVYICSRYKLYKLNMCQHFTITLIISTSSLSSIKKEIFSNHNFSWIINIISCYFIYSIIYIIFSCFIQMYLKGSWYFSTWMLFHHRAESKWLMRTTVFEIAPALSESHEKTGCSVIPAGNWASSKCVYFNRLFLPLTDSSVVEKDPCRDGPRARSKILSV